jgi:IclR family acetate operon transcriptional repressor
MVALVRAGLVERHGTAYRLGLHLFELGQQVPRQRDLERLARPVMTDLRDATRHTVHLAVLEGREVVYLDVLPGPDAPALPTRIGGRFPAHATAVGKAALAFAPTTAVESVMAGGLPRQSPRTVTAPARLVRELERVRERRLAYDLEEGQMGVVCVAAPVFGADGEVIAALSVSGWSGRMNLERMGAAIRPAAERLTEALRLPPG